jgi:hypothetical protein
MRALVLLVVALAAGVAYCYLSYRNGYDRGYERTTLRDYLRSLSSKGE